MLKKKDNLEYEFLPEALEIVETPPATKSRMLLWIIFLVLIISILWMYFGEVEMVATARGKVIPDGKVKVIQPYQEGVIQEIYVNEGEQVKKGDILLELDTTMNDIDTNTLQDEINTLKYERDILAGENLSDYTLSDEMKKYIVEANKYNSLSHSLDTENEQLALKEKEKQLEIERNNLEELQQNLKLLKQKKEEYDKLIDLEGAESIELEQIALKVKNLSKTEADYKDLYKQDVIAKVEWEEKYNELELTKKAYEVQKVVTQQEKIDMRMKLNAILQEIDEIKINIEKQQMVIEQIQIECSTSKVKIGSLNNNKNMEKTATILEKEKKIAELEAQLSKSEKGKEYMSIEAPVTGKIQGLGTNTLGGVVTPAEAIMTIVPDDTPLIIEAYLPNKDIGFVEENQNVRIKVDTFNYQKYGTLSGKIKSISPDAIEDEKLGYVYRMVIVVDNPIIDIDGKKVSISSGMTVTAEVKTGKRKIISFFLEPLVKYAQESISLR